MYQLGRIVSLFLQQTDEISHHGPPLGYSEDVFEKRHGVIRAKRFNQENQLARSRDTPLAKQIH